ncbi:1-aminocyclopropane-1-carboxylate deaminase/D-cysteine desulfhydrase [Campylobacter sp. 2018MI35]|nr:1-aminocyclopropane-1-carboxylate deaminase/D-cysteine desulfhydrase [Campylobacter sp. 2018MI34]
MLLKKLKSSLNINSPIEKISFCNFNFYIKRDDLLGEINGNKARKLYHYLLKKYPKNQRFISFGSSQSNALLALSIFCRQNNYQLFFVCEKLSSFLEQNPHGNYALALKNKATIIQNIDFSHRREKALSLKQEKDIFIEEGVANKEVEAGFIHLAKEIDQQSRSLNLDFDIFLPSGTGTSAAFLAKHSKSKVFTCACVGDEIYLKKQILTLDPYYDFSNLYILKLPKKYHFAKPYLEFYKLYLMLKQECNIEFDLLYDMLGIKTLMYYQTTFKKPILYIHQGGIIGNESMLERYKRKFAHL